MNTRLLITGAVVVALGIAGWFTLSNQNANEDAMIKEVGTATQQTNETMTPKAEDVAGKDEGAMMEKKDTAETMKEKTDSMMTAGSYETYSVEKLTKAATGDVVLFFRAGWCPTCRAVDADIRAHLKDIPSNLAILDVDYDNSTSLKQKYGVTYQHTFVQVDAQGNLIRKWSGSPTLAELVLEVK